MDREDLEEKILSDEIIQKRINDSVSIFVLTLDLDNLVHIRDEAVLIEKWENENRYHIYVYLEYTFSFLPDPGRLFSKLVSEKSGSMNQITNGYLKKGSKDKLFIHGININEPRNYLSGNAFSLFQKKWIDLSDHNICKSPSLV